MGGVAVIDRLVLFPLHSTLCRCRLASEHSVGTLGRWHSRGLTMPTTRSVPQQSSLGRASCSVATSAALLPWSLSCAPDLASTSPGSARRCAPRPAAAHFLPQRAAASTSALYIQVPGAGRRIERRRYPTPATQLAARWEGRGVELKEETPRPPSSGRWRMLP